MTGVHLLIRRIERCHDVVVGIFDAEIPSGDRVALAAFAGRSGRLVISGLEQFAGPRRREHQDAAAGAIRAAMRLELAEHASNPPLDPAAAAAWIGSGSPRRSAA